MDSYILYNAEFQVLICREHRCAIPPNFIERHFRREHKNIPLQIRQKIVQHSRTLETCDPNDVTTPMETVAPINGLKSQRGFQCMFDGCRSIGGTVNSIKEHSKGHKWSPHEARRWREIKIQTFFRGQYLRLYDFRRNELILVISPYMIRMIFNRAIS
jgi:Orsellinic acid/F9775 biosynthesis cluster protein D